MFWGHLQCDECAYCTENFMFGPHWNSWTHGVLIQNTQSLALRVFWIPLDKTADDRRFETEEAAERSFEAFTSAAIARELRPDEKHIAIADFVGREGASSVPCPNCRRLLTWHQTG